MKISMIAAMTPDRVIGYRGEIPWRMRADLEHFKYITTGSVVVMGRVTYESIGKPLPNRTNIIITNDKSYKVEGAIVVNALSKAYMLLKSYKDIEDEVFIIGGAKIYEAFLPIADKLYLTIVDANVVGDTFFPKYKNIPHSELVIAHHDADKHNEYSCKFIEVGIDKDEIARIDHST